MSFQKVPALIHTDSVPGYGIYGVNNPPMWAGKGADTGLYAFYAGSSWGGYIIVDREHLVPTLYVDGVEHVPVLADVNGYIYWTGNYGNIYFTMAYGWVLANLAPGLEPVERQWYDNLGEVATYRWEGDEFYALSAIPVGGQSVEAVPRGALRVEDGSQEDPPPPKEVTTKWPRWVFSDGGSAATSQFGKYEGEDGVTGQKIFGLPRFQLDDGTYIARSINKDETGHYTYGPIHCEDGRWLIGTYGSSGGWHEGSEPQVDGSVVFRFMKPEGSEARGSNITVAFDRYDAGDEKDEALFGEVAIWR